MIGIHERTEFQLQLDAIVTEVLDRAEPDAVGLHWPSVNGVAKPEAPNYFLYEGTAGVIYFLMHALKVTQVNRGEVEEVILKGINTLVHRGYGQPGLFNGRAGIAQVLILAYQTFGERRYLEIAKLLLLGIKPKELLDNRRELLVGNAGITLPLVAYYQLTGDPDILDQLVKVIFSITDTVKFGSKGVFWDVSAHHNRGLCGFSHGASGIGAVLVQLGQLFSVPVLTDLGMQAFRYENSHFNHGTGNWPDFRQGTYDKAELLQQFREHFLLQNIDFFYEKKDINAWCHGALGTGISRLVAAKALGADTTLKKDMARSLKKAREWQQGNLAGYTYSICHGVGGLAVLLLLRASVFGNASDMQEAADIMMNAIRQRNAIGYYRSGQAMPDVKGDISLLNGASGIGCLLIDLLQGNTESTALFTTATLQSTGQFGFKGVLHKDELLQSILMKHFPETMEHMLSEAPGHFHNVDFQHTTLKRSLLTWARPFSTQTVTARMEMFNFSKQQSLSFTYLDIWDKVVQSYQQEAPAIDALILFKPKGVETKKLNGVHFVIKFELNKIHWLPASDAIVSILEFFGTRCRLEDLIACYSEDVPIAPEARAGLARQVHELLRAGLLVGVR